MSRFKTGDKVLVRDGDSDEYPYVSEYYADMYADEILPDAKSSNASHMQATFWLYAKNGYKQGYIDAINNNDL